MDPPVKAGPLLLQQPSSGLRLGAKRWKKGWSVLYPASLHGVARLEFFDCKEGAVVAEKMGTKRLEKKIVRLADCVSVAPAPDCSPKEGLSAFRLETSERTYIFAAEPQESTAWMARLCEAAFPQGNPAADSRGNHGVEMAVNSLYSTRGEVREFWVTVQKTEAAERCRLQGVYLLKASREGLVLGEPHSHQPLYTWPYRLLRRYGRDKSSVGRLLEDAVVVENSEDAVVVHCRHRHMVMFSFEAGRRCDSGPGNFTFETTQGNEIFQVVEAAIQAQKAQAEENRQSSSSLDLEAPGVVQIQSTIANSLSLEVEGPVPEKRAPRIALSAKLSFATEEMEVPSKGPSLRDLIAQWPSTPPLSPLPGILCHPLPSEDPATVYSEPLDAVKAARPKPDSLYADPVDSGQGKDEHHPYSTTLLYEQVGPGTSSCQEPPRSKVHIYDEPEGRAPWPTPAPVAIYDEAHFPQEAWRTQGLETQAGYELPYLPGSGDYAVPGFHQKPGIPKPQKPCPAPKPPRTHKTPAPSQERPRNTTNNNNKEPVYSQVQKLPSAATHHPGHVGKEQSVDVSRPASVYEDLGEI